MGHKSWRLARSSSKCDRVVSQWCLFLYNFLLQPSLQACRTLFAGFQSFFVSLGTASVAGLCGSLQLMLLSSVQLLLRSYYCDLVCSGTILQSSVSGPNAVACLPGVSGSLLPSLRWIRTCIC